MPLGISDRNKMVLWPGCEGHAEFSLHTKNGAVRFKNEGMLLQPLWWCCVDCVIHHERDVHEEQQHTYVWREQAVIEWSWHMNSIVACCYGAKLCAYAARDIRSQQYWLSIPVIRTKSLKTRALCVLHSVQLVS